MNCQQPLPSYRQWFTYFGLFNLVFLILQLCFIFQKSISFISAIPLPASVYFWLFTTLFIHLSLYFIVSILQTTLIWGLVQRGLSLAPLERWHLTIWCLSVCALLTANAYFFPLSNFSLLFLPELPHVLITLLMFCSLFILGLLSVNALFFASRLYPKMMGACSLSFLSLFIYSNIEFLGPQRNTPDRVESKEVLTQTGNTHKQQKKPNIILIGVDSLTPNRVNPNDTPTLADFIKNSVTFTETISPLARTFPAWSSILTGLYPEHHRARYNLLPLELVKSSTSIAWTLQRLGYQTIFATDDRQFNNMGYEFGFQKFIGPRLGANDILLGKFNDFPLSNLLVNLPISRWLFPYNYSNRASHFTYYPQTFDKLLRNSLAHNYSTSPAFIAVHFTLPHWPYSWAKSAAVPVSFANADIKKQQQLYLNAVHQADHQVNHLLQTLQDYGYMDNSLVILLSDHGETLYTTRSRQTELRTYQGPHTSRFADYIIRKTSTSLERSMGHGSDLLSTDQYHCVLAFKIYKHNHVVTTSKIINTRVALIDLAPTMYDFLGITNPHAYDGYSLLKAIQHDNVKLPERAFVMESGMLPNQFISAEKARLVGRELYTIEPKSGRIQIRNDKFATVDADKLYALIEGDWVFALYPDDDGYIPATLHLSDGKWTDELTDDFAKKSPAIKMLNYLEHFYQKKLTLAGQQLP